MRKLTEKNCPGYLALLCILLIAGLSMTSCNQEESENIGDSQLFQRYMLAVKPDGETVAYAAFSKERNSFLKPVKLTGEQSISVNGKEMNYNMMDSYHMVAYSYSLKMDKNTNEVEFSFVRFKNRIIKNRLVKDNSLFVSLPADLESLEAGKAVNWNGAAVSGEETMEITLEQNEKNQYSQSFGKVTEDGKGFVFEELPKKGKYMLTVRRYRSVPTSQNDRDADGEMTLCYYDSRMIEIR